MNDATDTLPSGIDDPTSTGLEVQATPCAHRPWVLFLRAAG